MDEQIRQELRSFATQSQHMFTYSEDVLKETRELWTLDNASIQAYASCQIALQLARIADVLEEMYKSPAGATK